MLPEPGIDRPENLWQVGFTAGWPFGKWALGQKTQERLPGGIQALNAFQDGGFGSGYTMSSSSSSYYDGGAVMAGDEAYDLHTDFGGETFRIVQFPRLKPSFFQRRARTGTGRAPRRTTSRARGSKMRRRTLEFLLPG